MGIKYYNPKPIKNFIGREFEQEKIHSITNKQESAILVVHGRRRVGKTELIERIFQGRNILKFEGEEGGDFKCSNESCLTRTFQIHE